MKGVRFKSNPRLGRPLVSNVIVMVFLGQVTLNTLTGGAAGPAACRGFLQPIPLVRN